jgi:VanZ family protein
VRRGWVAWVPAAVWAAFLFYMSSRQTLPVDLDLGLDKVAHFAAYFVLGALLSFGTERLHLSPKLAVLLGFSYGIFDEIHQSLVPGRYPSVADWAADALGTLAGVFLFLFVSRRRASKRSARVGRTAEGIST